MTTVPKLALAGILACAGWLPSAAQNLAANPGFEAGNTAGWLPFGSPTLSLTTVQVHSGNYACLVTNRTASYMGICQPFAGVLTANQTYNVSLWLRLASGPNQTMQITAQKIDASGTTYAAITSGSVSSSAWTQLVGQYTPAISGTLTGLTVYAEVPTSTNAAFFIDDFLVQPATVIGTIGQCRADWTNIYQRVDGFGASSAWQSYWTSTEADIFFSTNSGTGYSFTGVPFSFTGAGLSLLRSRIAPGGTTVENSIMQMAQARGARVWSTPWSPAANFKNNGSVNGGSFVGNAANYQAYAAQLAGYVANMKKNYGINLYALSLQNEPDAQVTSYESCNWTGQQFHDFIPYLYGALAASNAAATQIMLPESQTWTDPSNLVAATMSDSTANEVAIVANHNYVPNNNVGDQNLPVAINNYGKALWETEVAILSGSDSSITNALYWAGRIHWFLTFAQANAWHYWWLMPSGSGNEGLTDTNGVPAKRLYAIGQFSRFVRPNYYRIGVTNSGPLLVSGYRDSQSPNFALVAINASSSVVTQTFVLANVAGVASVTPWLTTSGLSLAGQPPVSVANSSFTYLMPAQSIATFTGQSASNGPPVFTATGDRTINPGATLVVTNAAMDTNSPPQSITYALLSAPANATLNPTNGVFAWRAPLSQGGTVNPVSVRATDSGTPNLSATNSFTITVNPVALPSMGARVVPGGPVQLTITGDDGPDYSLLVSTNLVAWQLLFATNSPQLPITFVETNAGAWPTRFYRVQIGP